MRPIDRPAPAGGSSRAARRLLPVLLLAVILPGVPWHAAAESAPGAAESAAAAYFEDHTTAAGVDRPHHNRSFHNPYARIMEGYTALGAAVAVADYDGDGFDDLFVTDSSENGANLLYHNNGDFTFTEVGKAAGVSQGNDATDASANALWFDCDGDGREDLFVVRFGHSQLFRNRGDGTFQDITVQAGLDRYLNSIVAIAFDYDRDGDLDLVLGNYFQPVNLFDPDTPRFFPESFETADNGGGVTLYRNDGPPPGSGPDGIPRFTDVTDAAGLGAHTGWSLDLGHADADLDGDQDLFVASDFGTDRFFRNNGDGTFTDITEQAVGIDTKKGMNADWGDFDNDGLFDLFVTNITDEYMREGNFLWHNDGGLSFTDVSQETGTYDTGWGWAGKFFDYDNDGWLDLYVANGWVSGGPDNYVLDIFQLIVDPDADLADARNWPPMGNKTLSGYERNVLFHNLGGTLFRDEAKRHGLDSIKDARGVAVADFDNDGRLDLFVTNAGAEPNLYRNVLPTGAHWLELLLEGSGANRAAIGARVTVTTAGGKPGAPPATQTSFVNGGNGFASQSTRRVHFGLGPADRAERVEIDWPSGRHQVFEGVAADRLLRAVEGKPRLEPLVPGGGSPTAAPARGTKTPSNPDPADPTDPADSTPGKTPKELAR